MSLKSVLISVAALALATALPAAAQFYDGGCESASVRWMELPTAHYRVVYPEGLDSLALVYASNLETAAVTASDRLGFSPVQYGGRMPVVLHPFAGYSNGLVGWTPSHMSLYTCPDAYSPEAVPWETHLVTHESRHVAQIQYVLSDKFRWTSWISGELIGGGLQALYCGPHFFEGDAVCAETALTKGGRGRSADFLEYYRAAFAEGDVRDWWQWRYGSFGKFTPDYYKLGYLTMAGMRTLYDPDFTRHYYDNLCGGKWPLPVNVWGRTVRQSTGGVRFRGAWKAIASDQAAQWHAQDSTDLLLISGRTARFVQYESLTLCSGRLYAVCKGIDTAPQLVETGLTGRGRKELRPFASLTSPLKSSGHTLWWSEYVPGVLWSEKTASSDIFCYRTADHKVERLTRGGHFFNPTPNGSCVYVTEYPVSGGSRLVRMDAAGKIQQVWKAPDGVQIVESAVCSDGRVLVSAVSDDGYGIYDVADWTPVYGPLHYKIKSLGTSDKGEVIFTCDFTGVHECYALRDGRAVRLTCTSQGVGSPILEAGNLYCTSLRADGRGIYKAAPGDFANPEPYGHKFAEALTDQRQVVTPPADSLVIGTPHRYDRLRHAFRFHSWAPVYCDPDAIADQSFESVLQSASPGAMAFSQNDLETFTCMAGYSAEPYQDGWVHSGHLKLNYKGLPVRLEAGADISSSPSSSYWTRDTLIEGRKARIMSSKTIQVPYCSASLQAYVPMCFNSGGWLRGLIPQASVAVGSSRYTVRSDLAVPANRYAVSLRGYAMRQTAQDALYPRWGIGAEAGFCGRIGLGDFYSPSAYGLLYGYAPGFTRRQGLMFYGLYTRYTGSISGKWYDPYVTCLPRGLSSDENAVTAARKSVQSARFYLQYAIPFCGINSGIIEPLCYIKNLELIPHIDFSACMGAGGDTDCFASVGADFSVVLGNLLCIPYETHVGVTFSLNSSTVQDTAPFYVGPKFSIDL